MDLHTHLLTSSPPHKEFAMDRQHSVAGIGGFIRIGKREYHLRPLALGDLAELKAYIVSRRTRPLESLDDEASDPKHRVESALPVAIREARRRRGVTMGALRTQRQ